MSLTHLKELLVLGIVRAHPAHGYAIADMLKQHMGAVVSMTNPTIYAALRRFEAQGWIVGKKERDGNYPERLIYHLSSGGEAAYIELLNKCANAEVSTPMPLAVLIAHFEDLTPKLREETIERVLASRQRHLRQLRKLERHPGSAGVALDLMMKHIEADIDALVQLEKAP